MTLSSNLKAFNLYVESQAPQASYVCRVLPVCSLVGCSAQGKSFLPDGGRVTVIVIRRSLEAEPGTHCGNGLCSGIQQVQQRASPPKSTERAAGDLNVNLIMTVSETLVYTTC